MSPPSPLPSLSPSPSRRRRSRIHHPRRRTLANAWTRVTSQSRRPTRPTRPRRPRRRRCRAFASSAAASAASSAPPPLSHSPSPSHLCHIPPKSTVGFVGRPRHREHATVRSGRVVRSQNSGNCVVPGRGAGRRKEGRADGSGVLVGWGRAGARRVQLFIDRFPTRSITHVTFSRPRTRAVSCSTHGCSNATREPVHVLPRGYTSGSSSFRRGLARVLAITAEESRRRPAGMPQPSPPPTRSSRGTRARPVLTAAWAVSTDLFFDSAIGRIENKDRCDGGGWRVCAEHALFQ